MAKRKVEYEVSRWRYTSSATFERTGDLSADFVKLGGDRDFLVPLFPIRGKFAKEVQTAAAPFPVRHLTLEVIFRPRRGVQVISAQLSKPRVVDFSGLSEVESKRRLEGNRERGTVLLLAGTRDADLMDWHESQPGVEREELAALPVHHLATELLRRHSYSSRYPDARNVLDLRPKLEAKRGRAVQPDELEKYALNEWKLPADGVLTFGEIAPALVEADGTEWFPLVDVARQETARALIDVAPGAALRTSRGRPTARLLSQYVEEAIRDGQSIYKWIGEREEEAGFQRPAERTVQDWLYKARQEPDCPQNILELEPGNKTHKRGKK